MEAAEGRFAGEALILGLPGDDEPTRRFLVGVSGKGALSSLAMSPSEVRRVKATERFFEGVIAGVDVFVVVRDACAPLRLSSRYDFIWSATPSHCLSSVVTTALNDLG